MAHHNGSSAFKRGDPRNRNPYLDLDSREHQVNAWNRAWDSEQMLTKFNQRGQD